MSENRHRIRSVSDLYAADEIEVLLLEEIRDLEPPPSAYSRPEDIQDFEIAGSRTGGRISSQSSELDSPGVHSTVYSWDSHANYHGHYGHGDHHGHGSSSNALPWPRSGHLVFYCDVQGHLKTATGVVRLLLLVSSAACLATLCSSGTAKVSLFMLPLVGRLRLMIFVTVFCILVTALLLFLDISHVIYLFPFNWAKLNAWVFASIGLSYALSSTLLVLSIWEYHSGGWVPRRTRSQLSVAAGLGVSSAILAFLLSWIHGCSGSACKNQDSRNHVPTQPYKPVDNSSSSGVTLKERSPGRSSSWVAKNQRTKKHDGEANTGDGHRGNGGSDYERYREGANRKDHWASARQHFLPTNDDEDVEADGRKQQKTYGEGSSNSEANKGRCVPRKLPLESVERPSTDHRSCDQTAKRLTSREKPPESTLNNDVRNYWDLKESRPVRVTGNGFHWEMEGTSVSGKEESVTVTAVSTAVWSEQWRPPPDDVQPCSSKTVDPYGFT